jgi:hypothetical protein
MSSRKLSLLVGILFAGIATWSLLGGQVHKALAHLGLAFIFFGFWREKQRGQNLLLMVGFGLVAVNFVWAGEWVWVSIYAAIGVAGLLAFLYRRVVA